MKNKFKTTIKVLGILTACFMMASFSPSLDGRAVVVDQGVFPQGLFAKTVGYLPGDIISVANIAGDSTVDLLVIGALDPSDGIAIMLSPEAAAAVGISKDDNSIVKITKRNGQNERVYGTAVIAKQSVTPETSALEIDIAEEDFDETEEDAFSEDAFEEDILADDSTAADEEAALPEEENPIPEEEEEAFEEESVAEEDAAEDTAEESDEEASDFETIAATESEPVEENEETEDEDIPYDEQFEEEPLPEETAEEAVPEEAEALEEAVAEPEMEAESEPEPVAEPIAESEPVVEETEEAEPEEEIAEPAVEAEPEAEEAVSEAEPAEDEEKIEEELVTEYVPAEKWEVVIPDEVWAEEEYAESPASPTEDSEIPADTPYEEEDLLGMYTNPAISRYEDAMSDDYEEEDDEVEATDDYDEYAAIVLVPVNPEPSPAPAYQPEVEAEPESPASAIVPSPAPVPSPAVDESESYEITDNNYSKYMVDGLSDLKSGSYYIQIATLSIDENIMEIVNKYSANYPITIVPLSSGARKQVLIGPLSMDEYAVVLERFKAYGYKDAFLRKIK